MYVALTLIAVALVVFLAGSRKSWLAGAIVAFAQSMDITPLYTRNRRRRIP